MNKPKILTQRYDNVDFQKF